MTALVEKVALVEKLGTSETNGMIWSEEMNIARMKDMVSI